MRKKALIGIIAVVVLGGYAAYSFAMPHKTTKMKIDGSIYVLPKSFTLDLADGRYATLTVALVLAPGQSAGSTAEGGATPPEGFGTLPEEAAVRDIITNTVTNQTSGALISDAGRNKLKRDILHQILSHTDVKVADVLFTDVAVQ